MIEKSHRRQLMSEIKKKQSLRKQLMSANEVIYSLENCLKVFRFCFNDNFLFAVGERKTNSKVEYLLK